MATQTGSIDLKAVAQAGATAEETTQYFWFNSTDSGAGEGAGAHITETDKATFIADPANGGGNVLIDSDSVDVRDGTSVLAEFGSSGAQIGRNDGAHTVIDEDGMQIYSVDSNDNLVQLANIGYGEGNAQSGTAIAPYYTLGTRLSGGGIGNYSVAEGLETIARGYTCHAEGLSSVAGGRASHAEGYHTSATGTGAHAEGSRTTTEASYSHAEGYYSQANADKSHAEGDATVAGGIGAHAEGYMSVAGDDYSHAQNVWTKAYGKAQTVLGTYNIVEPDPGDPPATTHPSGDTDYGTLAVIIGNGTADDARSNALTVDWEGHVVCGSVKKNLIYTGEYISLYGNQTASESAGQLTLSGSYKNCLPANKYTTGKSPLADDLFSVSSGTVTILKAGRYKIYGQIYLYNGYTVNDQVTVCIHYNDSAANVRSSRIRAHVAGMYTTMGVDTYLVPTVNSTVKMMAVNDSGARGVIGLSGYTKMFIQCLGVYE